MHEATQAETNEALLYCQESKALLTAEAGIKLEPAFELWAAYKLYQQFPLPHIAGRLHLLTKKHMEPRIEDCMKFLDTNGLLISRLLRDDHNTQIAKAVQETNLKLSGFICTANLIAAENAIRDFIQVLAKR